MDFEVNSETRDRLRQEFPALGGEVVFLENAGGSQVPRSVVDRITTYMYESYVQLGAGYPLSLQSTELMAEAHRFVKLLMGGSQMGEVVLGSSTSTLVQMLADSYARILKPGQEIVVATVGHEANIGPWQRLEGRGAKILWWDIDRETLASPLELLAGILSERTALVAIPHVSNLLGEIVDISEVATLAHAVGARVVVDGVAYAPHRMMAVEDWDVDWYVFSAYKVYGPHMAALWGRSEALAELRGPNHFFIDDVPYQFELGGVCHEACAGLLGVGDYLRSVAGVTENLDRTTIARAFEVMTACELPLQARLIDYLGSRQDIRIIGPRNSEPTRVGTISFVHENKSSREITQEVDRTEIAIRHGHMYAYRLCQALGLDPEDGVVRVSMLHYNTDEEIERLIEVLESAFV